MVDDIVSRSTKIDHKASVVESPVMPNIGSAAFDFAEYIIKNNNNNNNFMAPFYGWGSTSLYISVPSIVRQHTSSYSK